MIKNWISLLLFSVGIILGLLWYEWKLLLVIYIFLAANNIEQGAKQSDYGKD